MSDNSLDKAKQVETITALIKDNKYAMMTTITADKGHLHACPMTTNKIELETAKIWFIGDKTTETVKDLQKNPQVNLSYTSQDHKDYVSINGTAKLIDDKAKLDELWSPVYNAFYEHGKEDPNVQIICVECNGAEYWQSGNSVINAVKMVAAAVQDGKIADSLGNHGSVTF